MSNSISHNLLQQSLVRHSVVLEHRNKLNSSSSSSAAASGIASLSAPQIRRSSISSSFYGNRLKISKSKLAIGTPRPATITPRAVLAMDPASELVGKFKLDGNSELQVSVSNAGSITQVNFQISYGSDSLLLHWGGIRDRKEKWILPSRCPDGTKNYKNRALRSPFVKSGSSSYLKIEIDDPAIQALEFLVLDEGQNKWFKYKGQNFHVKLPEREKVMIQNVSVPEELVQVQAYLRWERKGKQIYTPEQEKEEYDAARVELLEELARGTSVEDLRTRLTNRNDRHEIKEPPVAETKTKIPDDLVQIQSYIRWEKAGKPSYSPEQQLREFEEARQDLQREVKRGVSLDEIRKKIAKGEIQSKVSKQLQKQKYVSSEKIQRKRRDLAQLITKYAATPVEEPVSSEPKALKAIELFAKAKEEQVGGAVLNKKMFKLADGELLVLVTKPPGKTKIYVATDFREPVTLHWALSRNSREWSAPPSGVLPPGSVTLSEAAETQLTNVSSAELPYQVQSFELEIEEDNFVGMPFVLLSNGNWIKNKGSDFYIEFSGGPKQVQKDAGNGRGTAKALLDKIAEMESEAQKSFMHRFNIAADLMEQAKDSGELGLAGILVWMRFMATRQLIWNKNYNVKPREISKAQDRLTDLLQNIYTSQPQYREILRMIMSTVGRGGEGDVGQRIRDEILVIQRNNDCKGGMMEEWHQKLHNNTSPDDVVICQALIDYISSGFDISMYWKSLNENGITKERLLSYDRAIHSEPNFRRDQKDGLLRDLGNYMRTLKAVHSGADLESAIANCMGYRAEGQGFMVGVQINPISGLPSGFPELLQFVLEHVEDKNVEALLEGLLEARQELRPLLFKSHDRLKDLLFLDIALDSTVRTVIERGYEELNNAGQEKIMYFITLVLENLALSSDDNEDLIYCMKGWNHALSMSKSKSDQWALYAKSVLDRTRLALSSKAEWYQQVLQPSAEYLGSLLGVDQWAVNIFTEEIIRAGSAASLSSLLNRLDPILRKTANLGSWQVISPVEVAGYVVVVDELLTVQNKSYGRPTILVARRVKGEEEIPDGTVAVLTPDMPDVLSHVSVRARNGKVCFATCFDHNILEKLQAHEGKLLQLKPTSADIVYNEISEGELADSSSTNMKEVGSSPIKLVKKQFSGRYAISSDEFTSEMVGAKSRNISHLKGKVPSWIGIPTSVALPFGVFEKVLSDGSNKEVAKKLELLKKKLGEGDFSVLGKIRETVLGLAAPQQLVQELKTSMQSSGMPWPGDEGEQRWQQAWMAIKKVWASKWNERAYFSTRKVKLDHDYLCMAVLVQEIINADYAFVIHTTNPSSGDSSEIYAEVVRGLGETLVGAYPGRALSFVCKKQDLNSPQVLGYPSKPIGLFIRRSIIFRSDSNGEDLEGYAGAGLYDSVPMDEEEKVVIDYSSDPLIMDGNFRQSILSSIARAGSAIEELHGSAQDIEGVIRDGKLYVVQTRPQM
ncbi:alpha-glucan water dikinase, chloroplastic [Ricinus communis]|uniref:alpha-glucan, water dikinase n=1 Tax=Ricinus communis TaxID=3988 RepID=B9SPI3_RICCO|nr:alpha-glucan water dikinase, chloroplastic [Ricinus communis]EEF34459.1 alpha-glucan water dikinase, chloroplast precursor, putative [Ricinus communis]|eukprot:XP_002527902.1 alpha-glucan water dikinase, chloroplastic [Ricinus communis]